MTLEICQNTIEVLKKGIFPHFREFKKCGPKIFWGYAPPPRTPTHHKSLKVAQTSHLTSLIELSSGYASGSHKSSRIVCQQRCGLFSLPSPYIYTMKGSLNNYIRLKLRCNLYPGTSKCTPLYDILLYFLV